ncbi:hypothetical protein BSIN_3479 [Burkholderia singularis]|uniref:Uncharacterized protein n=1 Tax=Burkholderia singularis TaxID=1503053 RepID=A0A238HB78_9BURK|nr:hypothetical protein BSIN_3479 [Burkholderia singularis]
MRRDFDPSAPCSRRLACRSRDVRICRARKRFFSKLAKHY